MIGLDERSRTARWMARAILVAMAVAGLGVAPQAGAQGASGAEGTAGKGTPGSPADSARHYRRDRFAGKAGRYYRLVWGVDDLKVKLAESGQLVRFSWHVLDPDRARLLHDRQLEPTLEDPQAGVSLVVPALEKVGQLRQSAPPAEGKSYWMAFSNKGRRVKRGDRVNVVIGTFRAEGLLVD